MLEALARSLDGVSIQVAGRCSQEEIWSRIRAQIQHELLFVARPRSEPAPVDSRRVAPRPQAPAEPMQRPRLRSEPKPKRTWIEIVVVDQDDAPVPHEQYRLELPDGSVREGKLDGDGCLYVDDIDPGTCTLTLVGSPAAA